MFNTMGPHNLGRLEIKQEKRKVITIKSQKRLSVGSISIKYKRSNHLLVTLLNLLDDTDGDGDTHVTDGEAAEGRVLSEGLNAHLLGGDHLDHGGVTGLDELGGILKDLTGTTVHLVLDLGELAGNVGGVAIEDWCVTSADLTGVAHDDNLGEEGVGATGRVVLGITTDVTALDVLDGNVLDVEANVVTRGGLGDGLVVHLDGLDLSLHTGGGKVGGHTGLDDTGLDTADGDRSDTTDLVHILEGKTERLVDGALGGLDVVEGLEKVGALVPGHVGGLLDHVVTSPAGDGDELDLLGLEADLGEVGGNLVDDLVEAGLRVHGGLVVHLVDGDDDLLDTEGEGEESVLTGLAILGDTGLETTLGRVNDENGNIGLGGTGNHVLDEITVTGGIDDGEVELGGLELPESDIDGDTTLTLGLELVKNPCVLEGTLTELGGLLLELLDGTLVDTTALVDQVAGGGGLAGIDVADDDKVDVLLRLAHFVWC